MEAIRKYIVIISMILTTNLFATVRWITNTGNDSNDGSTELLAKATFTDTFNDYATAGDTIIVYGTVTGEFYPGSDDDGIANDNRTYIMTKSVYENGWSIGVTDTTILFDATITRNSGYYTASFDNVSYMTLIGLIFDKGTTGSGGGTIAYWGTGIGNEFYNCRIMNTNSTTGDDIITGTVAPSGSALSFYNCWFLSYTRKNAAMQIDLYQSNMNIVNCTFYGAFEESILDIWDFHDNGLLTVKNCILYNKRPSTGMQIIKITTDTDNQQYQFDYNIHYRDYDVTYEWYFNANIATFTTWQDSLQFYSVSNEVNSAFQDPDILYTTTTCVPNTQYNCVNLGYGSIIGAYQFGNTDILNRIIIID